MPWGVSWRVNILETTAYDGLHKVKTAMSELAKEKEPLVAAANEMEINMNGIALLVLRYLNTVDPKYRQRVEKDEQDFKRFGSVDILRISSHAENNRREMLEAIPNSNACRHGVWRERPGARADSLRLTAEIRLSIRARWR